MFGGLTRLGSLRAATDRPENMRQARDAPRRILIASRSKNRHASQFRECFDRTFLGKRPSLWLTDATLDDRLPDLFDLPWFIGHLLHWQLKMLLYSVTLYFHKLLNENFLHNLEYISSWEVWSTAHVPSVKGENFIVKFLRNEFIFILKKILNISFYWRYFRYFKTLWKFSIWFMTFEKKVLYLRINLQIELRYFSFVFIPSSKVKFWVK